MKKNAYLAGHLAAIIALFLALGLNHAHADAYKAGAILIEHPYAYASPGKVKNGAGFVTLSNEGEEGDSLIGVESEFAARNELHTHISQGGRMMMRRVDKIELPAGETVKLQPGGLHLMLMGLDKPLQTGERKKVTLVFEKAGRVEIELAVEERRRHGGHGKHGSHN